MNNFNRGDNNLKRIIDTFTTMENTEYKVMPVKQSKYFVPCYFLFIDEGLCLLSLLIELYLTLHKLTITL